MPGATCRRHSSPYVDQDDQQQQQQPLRGRRRLIRPGRRPTVVVVPEVASVCSLQRLDDASPTLSRTVSLRLDECNPPPDTGFGRRPSQLAGKVCASPSAAILVATCHVLIEKYVLKRRTFKAKFNHKRAIVIEP